MAISYALYENHLTSDPDDYTARVLSSSTAEMKDLIDRMVDRGSTVVRADILSVLEDYHAAIAAMLLEGMNVNTPACNFGATIKGVFNGQEDSFDKSRHHVLPTVSPGVRLKNDVISKAVIQKVESSRALPTPLDYFDVASGERNSVLAPGGMGQVLGHRLKFDADDPLQGVFFKAADNTETRVTVVGRNKPGELMFMVPELAAGAYTLLLRVAYGDDDLREGVLRHALTVAG